MWTHNERFALGIIQAALGAAFLLQAVYNIALAVLMKWKGL
jgi:hypothetical protein